MDLATIGGVITAIGMIVLGQILEGGHPGSLMQLTAFIIVVGEPSARAWCIARWPTSCAA